tara:strand:- start:8771 stop:11038 length:2268 start_codon:yes stop_codon:yes gene_type:complete
LKIAFFVWIASFILAAIYSGYSFSSRQIISTDILSILSDSSSYSSLKQAKEKYDSRQSRQLVIAFKSASQNKNVVSFKGFARNFCASKLFSSCDYLAKNQLDPHKFYQFYQNKKANILSRKWQQKIENDPESFVSQRYKYLLSPIGGGELSFLEHDPFGVLSGFFRNLDIDSSIQIDDSLYKSEKAGESYYFIFAELVPNWKSLNSSLIGYIDGFKKSLSDGEEIYALGASLYFEAGADKSMKEANVLASLSLMAVALLLFLSFGSFLPMIASIVCILYSVLLAFSVSVFIFDQIHVFVFLMGISLMGVICDYCIHYFSHRLQSPEIDAKKTFSAIRSALLLSLLSSCLGYASFSFSGMDLLRQLSVFAVVGLLAAYFSVYAFLGIFSKLSVKKDSSAQSILIKISSFKDRALSFVQRSFLYKSLGLLFAGCLLLFVDFDYDVTKLQEKEGKLVAQEALIKDLSGMKASGDYFLVSAESQDKLLELEESLRSQLEGKLTYNAISKWVPSAKLQESSRLSFDKLNQLSKQLFAKLGVKKDLGDLYVAESSDNLDLEEWLASSVSWRLKDLYLGKIDNRYYSVIPLFSDSKETQLSSFSNSSIQFVSKTKDIAKIFTHLGERSLLAIALIFLLLFGVFSIKEGLLQSFDLFYAALMGVLVSIGISNLLTGYIDFFHILGAFLVFFLAVDYSFFCNYAKDGKASFLRLGLFLSALTSLFSFGILAFSATNAVSHFGMALSLGILTSYVFSFVKGEEAQ